MSTTGTERQKNGKKLLQLTELKTEGSVLETQFETFWGSL